ncbi:MAG TPA: Flp family type IVb pilin, partial [Anaerolinea sp.]|nr:Flp family type IVb pilin [Anaerolinea sp.]
MKGNGRKMALRGEKPGGFHPQPRVPAAGQGLIEYALIVALVAVVIIAILAFFGPTIRGAFGNVLAAVGVNETWTPVPYSTLAPTAT